MSADRFALPARYRTPTGGWKGFLDSPREVPVVDSAGSPLGAAVQVRRWRRLLRRPTVVYRSPVPLDGRAASGCWNNRDGRFVLVEVMLVATPGFPISKARSW